jgi:hypothetical protein
MDPFGEYKTSIVCIEGYIYQCLKPTFNIIYNYVKLTVRMSWYAYSQKCRSSAGLLTCVIFSPPHVYHILHCSILFQLPLVLSSFRICQ